MPRVIDTEGKITGVPDLGSLMPYVNRNYRFK